MPVRDAAPGKIIRGEFDRDAVAGKHTDVVGAHLASKVTQHRVSVFELNHEHRVGKGVFDATVDGDRVGVLATRTLFNHGGSGSRGTNGFAIRRFLGQRASSVDDECNCFQMSETGGFDA